MRKLFLALSALFLIGMTSQARAEDSAQMYEINNVRSYQVYIEAYNAGAVTLNKNEVAALAIGAATDGSTKGAWILSTSTTDSIFTMGVSDEAIAAGSTGRICLRGPHKVVLNSNTAASPSTIATGNILTSSTQLGKAGVYATADGTAGGQLGYLLSITATTDTGDASNTYWANINPRFHK